MATKPKIKSTATSGGVTIASTSVAELEAAFDGLASVEEARMRGLRNFARRVFVDRNAAGMPDAYRAQIKASTRHHHREAIALIRAARSALRDGDAARWELLATKAAAKLEHIQVLFREPVRAEKAQSIQALRAASKGPRTKRVDHDEVLGEFWRLLKDGHTPREARGMLTARGLASKATIHRITKGLTSDR